MASIRDQILTNTVAALNAAGTPAVAYRSITKALSAGSLPAYGVLPGDESIQRGGDYALRQFTMRVIAVAAAVDATEATDFIDSAVDPLLVWAEQQLALDPTLSGLANDVVPVGISWSIDVADRDYVGAEMRFQVSYFTAIDDPEVSKA